MVVVDVVEVYLDQEVQIVNVKIGEGGEDVVEEEVEAGVTVVRGVDLITMMNIIILGLIGVIKIEIDVVVVENEGGVEVGDPGLVV